MVSKSALLVGMLCVSWGMYVAGDGVAGHAFGFGAGTTGGGNSAPQEPKNTKQLAAWLADNVPRVIVIRKTYDFTLAERNASGPGCKPWNPCPNGNLVQLAKDYNHWCQSSVQGRASSHQVQYQEAPLQALPVGSNKSLVGIGSQAVLKGKGLLIKYAKNVIIQNIAIHWLNPQLVWGGDAIFISGATNVWIDHCTISDIGRQMIVTGAHPNFGITLSNNLFFGKTGWSARCQNKHYWAVLLTAPTDQVTMANNCFDSTSGRSPKVGGFDNPSATVHYYNNLHTDGHGESFEIAKGGTLLAEGNAFKNIQIQDPGDAITDRGGQSYVPFTAQDANACKPILGRPCVSNISVRSAKIKFGLNLNAVRAFSKFPYITKKPTIVPASTVLNGVPGGCGVGKV